MSLLQIVITAVSSAVSAYAEGSGSLLSMVSDWVAFGVQGSAVTSCDTDSCPGSQFTQIAAAWANIGYVTHSDVLHYITTTKFGLWAPLLYACAALGALVGVAINMPMRSYVWFMLGPAIYGFLIGTTTQVQGVNWVVANEAQDMTDVWRNAEVGLTNTESVASRGLTVNGRNGPQRMYEVAMPMVFLDELFSATSNLLIEWLGVYRHKGDGSANSNLAPDEGKAEGPWYLLSSLKWGMVENIVGVTARNPDFRDAFVTFLASECGDSFKKGIDSGKYSAAGSAYGAERVASVMVGNDGNVTATSLGDFSKFQAGLDTTAIQTPRSLGRIFTEGTDPGQFGRFSSKFDPVNPEGFAETGRTESVVCSDYLYTLVQQLRFEAGHSYWQLVRSSPNGLTRNQFLKTLFYGWDIRLNKGQGYATPAQMNAFVKHLTMVYLLRNELMFAPQITETNQRFAPSEQSRSFSEAHVRTMGSKSKYQELYNWAVLMPHMQGILVYFLVVAYPFAAMVMVLPGYYKTFLTWISFFAWVKLWDVGFAVVMVLERSVWAMIGNSTSMGSTANMLIRMAENAGGIGVGCSNNSAGSSLTDSRLSELCQVPDVCSINGPDSETCGGQGLSDQDDEKAWYLLDKLLILSASADLDLANGYYIYIMAALYFAVPAVTGQLVLGAKAGAASMLNSAIGSVAGEAGRAASTGYQHQVAAAATSNSGSVGQAAYAKGMRQSIDEKPESPSFAQRAFGAEKAALDEQHRGAKAGLERTAVGQKSAVISANADGIHAAVNYGEKALKSGEGALGSGIDAAGTTLGGSSRGNSQGPLAAWGKTILNGVTGLSSQGLAGADYVNQAKKQDASAWSAVESAKLSGTETGANLRQAAHQQYGNNVSRGAEQNAQMVAWEARNQFAAHASGMAGVAGMNSGALSPGTKPSDMKGMGMLGELDGYRSVNGKAVAQRNAPSSTLGYAAEGGGFLTSVGQTEKTHEDGFSNFYERNFHAPTLTRAASEGLGASENILFGEGDTHLKSDINKK
jgi:hypothetical protein